MDGKGGKALTDESIHEAVAFRQLMAKLNADFADQGEWFFNCWQPDFVKDAEGKKNCFSSGQPRIPGYRTGMLGPASLMTHGTASVISKTDTAC